MLGRKDKADSTRNALSVLQRFKFLFYLPLNIDRNIKRVSWWLNKLRYSSVSQGTRSDWTRFSQNITLKLFWSQCLWKAFMYQYFTINLNVRYKIWYILLQGDYSLVINDYVRARSLFANTQVQVFKKGELQFLCQLYLWN